MVINFIRLNDDRLYRQIFLDTNDNILLQEKTNFDYYANLFEDNIKDYLKNLQRNQLKFMTKKIYNFTHKEKYEGETLSKKKNLFDSIEVMTDGDLLKTSFKFVDNAQISSIFDLIKMEDKDDYEYSDEENLFFLFLFL